MLDTAFLVATTDCHLSCGYCFYVTGHQKKVRGRIDASNIGPIFRALAEKGVKSVVVTGGEPAERRDLERTVAEGARAGLAMVLLTAGRRLPEERLSALQKAGLTALTVALDGELSRSLKTVRPAIAHLVLETPVAVTLLFTLTRKNLASAGDVLAFASALSIGMLLEPVYVPEGHALRPSLSLACMTPDERERLDDFLGRFQEIYGEKRGIDLVRSFYGGGGARPLLCPMGAGGAVVNADGALLPCFHREDLAIGNLLDEDPREVLARRAEGRYALGWAPCFGEHCLSLFMNS